MGLHIRGFVGASERKTTCERIRASSCRIYTNGEKTRNETWVLVLETACLVVAGVGACYVYEPFILKSFLGWEMGVFACCCASVVWALMGIYSTATCGGSAAQQLSSKCCFKWFGVMSFYHCFALLFLVLHTFIAQPLSWYEMEKHWGLVSWRFLQFQHLKLMLSCKLGSIITAQY